jgi:hypothetical protein
LSADDPGEIKSKRVLKRERFRKKGTGIFDFYKKNEMNLAHFRFYEELNEFLSPRRRKVSFDYSFKGNPSVKDAIEALGVPHVEVDMILVNGNSIDFSYRINDGDQVSVYPVFESLNVSNVQRLRPQPLREPKFILDVHLGRLSKYMRLCGFDSLFERDLNDREIVSISVSERRIILTRDRDLLKARLVTHGYWIRSKGSEEQLKEVLRRFDLNNDLRIFTRCLECNGMMRDVPKEEIIDQLMPKTRDYYSDFKKCGGCGKIYWEGSHYERMKKFIQTVCDF